MNNPKSSQPTLAPDRRQFLAALGATGAGLGLGCLSPGRQRVHAGWRPRFRPAESCIFIWLGGGACHIDTFDPKRQGDAARESMRPGSYYSSIPTAIEGVDVCEHLPETGALLDRGVLIRSLNHDVVDEHAAATNRLHVGRPPTGTTLYPSIGSVVSSQLTGGGSSGLQVPPYIVMGYPNATRGPGFLGARHGYIYLTDTRSGPNGLKRPDEVSSERQARRDQLLEELTDDFLRRSDGDRRIGEYVETSRAAYQLASPDFMRVFDMEDEHASIRESYGGEFGQRCLLALRLVREGVRFVEVSFNLNFINGTGWDTHNDGQLNQHVLIRQLDQALGALIPDLEHRGLLDQTLVVVATEFGRPPEFDGGGGRGHHSRAFSAALFGGGLAGGQVVGETDELGREIVADPVSIPDFHATIYHALGIDPAEELYDGDRPVPITDGGIPLEFLF